MFYSHKTRTRQKGLTSIEALVTMAVLGAGLAGIAASTSFLATQVRRNHARFLAGSLAELVMEEVRSFGCDPNLSSGACARLVENFDAAAANASFPRLYCWPPKGEPTVLTGQNRVCDPGHLFQVNVRVTAAAPAANANAPDFRRARLTAGVLPEAGAPNVNLQNIANVRVTTRWGDVRLDNAFDTSRRPQFVVYQTRVTQ